MAKRKPAAADPAALGKIPREWSWYASGPLRGCALMRERCRTVVWDAGNVVTTLDVFGTPIASFACPQPIMAVAAADSGSAVAVVGQSGRLWWLDGNLETQFLRDRPGVPVALALDSHGQYAALAWEKGLTQIVGADNREYATIETRQPLKRLLWTAADGYLFGAAENGIAGLWDSRGREFWSEGLWVGIGGAAANGDGDALFLACPQQGILRFNLDGKREGCYRLDGLPTLVASDYAGRRLVAATNDKKLIVLSYHGVVEATRTVPDEIVGLQMDALGRFAVWATRAGELRMAALEDLVRAPAASLHVASATGLTELADWEAPIAGSIDEARTAVLEYIPGTDLVGVLTSSRKTKIFDAEGKLLHESDAITGIGRGLRGGSGWLLASTDGNLLAYDPTANRSWTAVEGVFDTSHAEPLGAVGEALHVSSCEFVARIKLSEGEVWKFRADDKIDTVAVQPGGAFAATFEDRLARFYDPAGKPIGAYRANPPEPLSVAALADGGWATLGRDSRTLRGHEPDGRMLWNLALSWAPWGLRPLGDGLVAFGDRGESLLVDSSGMLLDENREPRPGAQYAFDPAGEAVRVHMVENALVATDFAGKVRWRHAAEKPVAAFATNGRGVWAIVGKTLCWFPFGA